MYLPILFTEIYGGLFKDGTYGGNEACDMIIKRQTMYQIKLCTNYDEGSAPDFWGRCPGFDSGIAHNDCDALQDLCVIM